MSASSFITYTAFGSSMTEILMLALPNIWLCDRTTWCFQLLCVKVEFYGITSDFAWLVISVRSDVW